MLCLKILGLQTARQPGQNRDTLFTEEELFCLYNREEERHRQRERERERDSGGG